MLYCQEKHDLGHRSDFYIININKFLCTSLKDVHIKKNILRVYDLSPNIISIDITDVTNIFY